MYPLKDILQNRVMGIAPARRILQRRHRTGDQCDPMKSAQLFAAFAELSPEPLERLDVLELGPGRGTGLMVAAAGEVRSYAAFDVEPYLDRADVEPLGVDYRVDGSGRLPWDEESFDLIWSHSVLEHVRDIEAVIDEQWRVLRGGGAVIAEIDLQDHYGDRKKPEEMYACLRYSTKQWLSMTSNRSAYVNRLRASEWRATFERRGFEILSEEHRHCEASVAEFRRLSYLDAVSDSDLLAAGTTIVAVKRG